MKNKIEAVNIGFYVELPFEKCYKKKMSEKIGYISISIGTHRNGSIYTSKHTK